MEINTKAYIWNSFLAGYKFKKNDPEIIDVNFVF